MEMKKFFSSLCEFVKKMLSDPNGDISSKRVAALGCFLAAFILAAVYLIIKHNLDGATGVVASFCGSGTTILGAQAITKT